MQAGAAALRRSERDRSLGRFALWPADRGVVEAELPHRFRIEKIAPVEDERGVHFFPHRREIDVGELRPFRGDDERLGAFHRFERRIR